MVSSNHPIYSFYNTYKKENPGLVFFFMIITLSFYLVWWIFSLDKKFQEAKLKSPSSSKWLLYILLLPIIIWVIFFWIETFYMNTVIEGLKIALFYIVIILQLKFLYDFSVTFAKVTNTNPLIWYYSLFFWILSLVLIYFESFYTLIFMFFPISAIPAMQAFLNKKYDIFHNKEVRENHHKHKN